MGEIEMGGDGAESGDCVVVAVVSADDEREWPTGEGDGQACFIEADSSADLPCGRVLSMKRESCNGSIVQDQSEASAGECLSRK